MSEPSPRRATEDDVDAIERLVDAAFGTYVERIGKPPAPMVADYAANRTGTGGCSSPSGSALLLQPEPAAW